eukprot:CAMPEP_0202960766 /NCGR_PEP_ID=MMETSP1396-20130829/4913_1 /ASSEMBLY_ACC=CAM_ASM_000872 /TAXON_ID= /ORGANISM="Pseudokeronopsis sp., Strain Brazil" /LENGTH=45 /DNA_ID= /DNA_START= /DNA_END= /DNA_ORIENTATION=
MLGQVEPDIFNLSLEEDFEDEPHTEILSDTNANLSENELCNSVES